MPFACLLCDELEIGVMLSLRSIQRGAEMNLSANCRCAPDASGLESLGMTAIRDLLPTMPLPIVRLPIVRRR